MSRQNDPYRSQHSPSISLSQIAASALAASAAAFAASYLGVTGTIIGAAVASVIFTVGNAMFHHSFRRSGEAVRRTATLVRPAGSTLSGPPSATPDLEHTRVLDIAPEPPRVRTPMSWRRTALAAAAVLGITLAGLTAVETVLGKPLSALLGGTDTGGTSLTSAVGGGSGHHATVTKADSNSATTTTPAPTSTPTPSAEPTTTPDPTPTPTPTPDPTGTPTSDPTATPTDPVTP